ncbi:phosphoglycerate dehydrogenase, partial [Candidatus Poribacteria bacterium]|nr:phosphoglycerate dehydrogenase [Candidatus Poribacteria bacterium]
MATILLLARAFREHGHAQVEAFEAAGHTVVRSPAANAMDPDEFLACLAADGLGERVDAIVAGGEKMTAAVFDAMPRLRIIARWGIGYDMVDLAEATRRGVYVTNTPGLLSESVADLAFGMMMALARRLLVADRQTRSGDWSHVYGVHVWRKTLGIVGFGGIGQALARRARGFDMTVVACDPKADTDAAERHGVRLTDLDELLACADFVSLHADLNDATNRMMDDAAFARMKRGSFLVNTARGGLVDEAALLDALEDGQLAGAGLDTHAVEPLPADHPMLGRDDVLLTPHIGFSALESVAEVNASVADAVLDALEGRRPRHVVNAAGRTD